MALESYQVHAVSCDIPDCKEKKTSGSLESLRDSGWATLELFGKTFEVCPEHQEDIREFFLSS